MGFFGTLRNTLAAIFLVLLGAALAMMADHPDIAAFLFKYVAGLGAAVLLVAFVQWRLVAGVRDHLGELLAQCRSLSLRKIANQDEFEAWKRETEAWYVETRKAIGSKLSNADLALFENKGVIVRLSYVGTFNGEHNDLLNTLNSYAKTLHGILERFLASHP